jgi:hypothetical protein
VPEEPGLADVSAEQRELLSRERERRLELRLAELERRLVIVIGLFSLSSITFIKLLGVGMIVALILDATLVRMLLVPAVMRLAGDANWWTPAPLRRFYARHGIHEDDGPPAGPVEVPEPEPVGT